MPKHKYPEATTRGEGEASHGELPDLEGGNDEMMPSAPPLPGTPDRGPGGTRGPAAPPRRTTPRMLTHGTHSTGGGSRKSTIDVIPIPLRRNSSEHNNRNAP